MRVFEAPPVEADGVSGECGQVGDEFVVSADGQLIRGDFRGVFHRCQGGSAGGDYRVFAGGLVVVGEGKLAQCLAQVPGEIGGEHADQHVAADPVFQIVVDGTQVDVFGFIDQKSRSRFPRSL